MKTFSIACQSLVLQHDPGRKDREERAPPLRLEFSDNPADTAVVRLRVEMPLRNRDGAREDDEHALEIEFDRNGLMKSQRLQPFRYAPWDMRTVDDQEADFVKRQEAARNENQDTPETLAKEARERADEAKRFADENPTDVNKRRAGELDKAAVTAEREIKQAADRQKQAEADTEIANRQAERARQVAGDDLARQPLRGPQDQDRPGTGNIPDRGDGRLDVPLNTGPAQPAPFENVDPGREARERSRAGLPDSPQFAGPGVVNTSQSLRQAPGPMPDDQQGQPQNAQDDRQRRNQSEPSGRDPRSGALQEPQPPANRKR